MKQNEVKTIDVNCMEWFDKVNGNSYFAGRVTVNFGMPDESTFFMPFQYGYGDQYAQEAKKELVERGFISPEIGYYGIERFCRENGIIYRGQLVDKCKNRDLKAIDQLIEQSSK